METLSDLHDAIASNQWFVEAGNSFEADSSITRVVDFTEALQHWDDPRFADARAVAWEAFRGELCKDEKLQKEWSMEFQIVNQLVRDSVSGSQKGKSFVACTEISIDDFCRDLPFVGAAGEILIRNRFPGYAFFTSQLKYYFSGHWVCGWHGELREDCFHYPAIQFYTF
jgi:hypothetical protein